MWSQAFGVTSLVVLSQHLSGGPVRIPTVVKTSCLGGRGSCPTHHCNLRVPAAVLIPAGEAEGISSVRGLSVPGGAAGNSGRLTLPMRY